MTDFTKPLFMTGVILSAASSGFLFSLSALTIPSLLAGLNHPSTSSAPSTSTSAKLSPADAKSPKETALLLTQWRSVYAKGVLMGPGMFLGAALSYLGNAYLHYAPSTSAVGNALGGAWGTRRSYLFISAAVVNISIVPFTFIFMRGINMELHRREEKGRDERGEWTQQDPERRLKAEGTSEEIVKRWSMLNSIRGLFPLVAVWLAFEAI